ncbi:MAG TPA: AMP-binding protein, partial [Caldimonas sp.]
QDLVAQLNEHRTTILATYPTVALMLAEHARAGTLRLALKEIWTGGEGLTAAMRGHISRCFGCPVSQSYGASEFFTIASECRCGGLHVNSDWVVLESVDEHHGAVPIGSAGSTTLLTNLANHVQPLIRYDLGDRVTFQALPCPCGSALPVIEVQGRIDDTLVLLDAHGRAVPLLPLAVTTVLEDEAAVFDFQLRHTEKNVLLLRIGAGGSAGAESLKRAQTALKRFLGTQGLAHVTVRARCGAQGLRARSGKVQRVVGLDPSLSGRSPR